MKDRAEIILWAGHRLSALLLAPLVLIHLATMIIAIQGGLSAEEVLSRTKGSVLWAGFYGVFVVAASVHGAIGLRTVVQEKLAWRGGSLDFAAAAVFAGLIYLGLRAVAGVVT